ncbi:MAG: TIGR02281 family clan AA aspartic protease [Nitrospinaceae bacterium]
MSNPSYSNKSYFRRSLLLAAAGVVLLWSFFPSSGGAGVYSWKDDQGNIHFTDNLHSIPQKYRSQEKGMKTYRSAPRPTFTPPASSPLATSPREGRSSGRGAGQEYTIPLIPTAGGNFMVETLLNNSVKARLMVDTGASLVILSDKLARKLGHRAGYGSPEIPFTTAGGMVWMPILALDTLRVGDAKGQMVEAGINTQLGELDGLLGMSFLSDFKVEMDQTHSRMILKPLTEPGGQTWEGKPAVWWKARFLNYANKIREFQKEAKKLESVQHPKAGNMEKMVAFYEDLHRQLNLRASRAGVPLEYRSLP